MANPAPEQAVTGLAQRLGIDPEMCAALIKQHVDEVAAVLQPHVGGEPAEQPMQSAASRTAARIRAANARSSPIGRLRHALYAARVAGDIEVRLRRICAQRGMTYEAP